MENKVQADYECFLLHIQSLLQGSHYKIFQN